MGDDDERAMMSDQRDAAVQLSVAAIRYGVEEALPERRELRAGPLTVVLENGDLRYIRLGDEEIVRRVYGAVRDQNWGTVAPRFTRYDVDAGEDAFAVRFTAELRQGDVDFVWDGSFVGTSEGIITCSFAGRARAAFKRNRIGWCVLHPMSLAGLPATVVMPEGEGEGGFPERIAPHQPFLEMREIRHPTRNGGEVSIRFEGDLFEMEDQRNWTDASYKTYSTPLRLPYPVVVAAGDQVNQTVTIAVQPGVGLTGTMEREAAPRVTVGEDAVGSLPPIGFGVSSRERAIPERERALLMELGAAHLRVVVELDRGDWGERLEAAITDVSALGATLEIEAVADAAGSGLDDLCERLRRAGPPVARLLVFERESGVTTAMLVARAREAARRAELEVPVGGGSRAYFTQLNRAVLPVAEMDVVGYGINPQVHAFDNASLVETLAAQAVTVASAREIAGERPLAVGPVTLRPQYNPDATGPEAKTEPSELPPSVDPRQSSLFAAGWTVGSLRSLAGAGADTLTYFETTGWRGLIERSDHPLRVAGFHSVPGMVFPLYHVFADLAEFAGGELLAVEVDDRLRLDALALRKGGRRRLLVASFGEQPVTVELVVDQPGETTVRRLDETTYRQATERPEEFRRQRQPVDKRGDRIELNLAPFAVATIDFDG